MTGTLKSRACLGGCVLTSLIIGASAAAQTVAVSAQLQARGQQIQKEINNLKDSEAKLDPTTDQTLFQMAAEKLKYDALELASIQGKISKAQALEKQLASLLGNPGQSSTTTGTVVPVMPPSLFPSPKLAESHARSGMAIAAPPPAPTATAAAATTDPGAAAAVLARPPEPTAQAVPADAPANTSADEGQPSYSSEPTCTAEDVKDFKVQPVTAGSHTKVTICSDPNSRVALLVAGQKVADADLVGEFITKPLDLTHVDKLKVEQRIGATVTSSLLIPVAKKAAGEGSGPANQAAASKTSQSPCLNPGSNAVPFIVGTPAAVQQASLVICADPDAAVQVGDGSGKTLDTESRPFGVFLATADIREDQTVQAEQILGGNHTESNSVQAAAGALSPCHQYAKGPDITVQDYPMSAGMADIIGCVPAGTQKVTILVNGAATEASDIDPNGTFHVHLGKALATGDYVRIKADNDSRSFTEPVGPPSVDWGRVQADFTAGLIVSKQNSDFSKTDPYLALHVEDNFFQNWAAVIYPCDDPRNLDIDRGTTDPNHAKKCKDYHKGKGWTKAKLFSAFFDARLTSAGVSSSAQQNSAASTTSAANPVTSSSAKSAFVRGGLYIPVFWNAWTWINQRHRNALFMGPVMEGGIQTFTNSIPAQTPYLNSSGVYDFWEVGTRIGQYTFRGASGYAPPYWGPRLNDYVDITIGKWANFVQPLTGAKAVCSAATGCDYRLPWKIGLEGRIVIPRTAFELGFDSNFWHGVSDLRFIFGYKFNIGDALSKLSSASSSQQ